MDSLCRRTRFLVFFSITGSRIFGFNLSSLFVRFLSFDKRSISAYVCVYFFNSEIGEIMKCFSIFFNPKWLPLIFFNDFPISNIIRYIHTLTHVHIPVYMTAYVLPFSGFLSIYLSIIVIIHVLFITLNVYMKNE